MRTTARPSGGRPSWPSSPTPTTGRPSSGSGISSTGSAFSAGYLGERGRLFAADDLDAVADDLDALGTALQEIAEVPDHLVLGPENRDLCRECEGLGGAVR